MDSSSDPGAPAVLKFRNRCFLFMGVYVALNGAAIFGLLDGAGPPVTWIFALVVAAMIAAQIWAMLAWMRESDEFVRGVASKRFIVASGIAMALAAAWGFLEYYADASHLSPAAVVIVFYGAYGLVSPFIRTSH